MPRYLQATTERFPVAGSFTISRGTRTHADVVTCTIHDGSFAGIGECVPYSRYGESIEGVVADIEAMAERIAAGLTRQELQQVMKPGAARNAVDCALWDLEAKMSGKSAAEHIFGQAAKPLVTAYTISLADPETMAAKTAENAARPLLKIKTGTTDDEASLRAVRAAAPEAHIIIDANEGWNDDNIEYYLKLAAELNIALIEQPLPADKDAILARIDHPVPICADESVHSTKDLAGLRDRYDAINIKLDKTGGLTEALVMKAEGERLGFTIMVGCMLGTSLGMAPAVLAAQDAAFSDLDGPLILMQDRQPGLVYEGSLVYPPRPELWG
ncbi:MULTISPECIES: N-acetyl-D-Glu racemase DgcA [unclassified Rhizobium]|uniref:N-acetyl-D-Glu racemase DgcA n=1 Tax=unclassified Rhizobium TaxID=2613769 RepID=UPI0024789368|nr:MULTISPECIES: N-acetyl-D-Glu racemase DgcA [unclassified Rhizobium]MDH7800947.1 L-alanine-DL-glutamate epimerase-like enolase superfamily enzyme [Rhizobium sp. AN70]